MMLSFDDGFAKIMSLAHPVSSEVIPLHKALNRTLTTSVRAQRPQPAFDASAMDGFALSGEFNKYDVVAEIAAGSEDNVTLNEGQAARIFTGAPLPKGADRVIIQENATLDGTRLSGSIPQNGANIRKQGSDFKAGFELKAPVKLTPEKIALIAAMNCAKVPVARRFKALIIPTGTELIEPGGNPNTKQVISSNPYGLAALIERNGGLADISPICTDSQELITRALRNTKEYDLIVTSGGASVGDYDFVPDAAKNAGFEIHIHKIAMRPGKPILVGKRNQTILLGLPGNPVSALITGSIFIEGLSVKLTSGQLKMPKVQQGVLKHDLPENGDRLHFMRGTAIQNDRGYSLKAFSNQDSANLSILSESNALIMRQPFAQAAQMGDPITFILRS